MQLESATSEQLSSSYQNVRARSQQLVASLSEADAQLQSMPDASPAKWHLAHTTWFFETFLLERLEPNFTPLNPHFRVLFNSYYNGIGEQYTRADRGLISRPSLAEVMDYRHQIDVRVEQLISADVLSGEDKQTLILGLHHEQQHQELLLMDIKHALFQNPMYPAYQRDETQETRAHREAADWLDVAEGVYRVGNKGEGFSFDNEGPEHKTYIGGCQLSSALITNAEFLEFIQDGGYQNPHLWLSDGWAWCQSQQTSHPLYWRYSDDRWYQFSLYGLVPLCPDEPLCHINFYEAQAFATWAGCRLPTEFEWEVAAQLHASVSAPSGRMSPCVQSHKYDKHFYHQLWQWTSSSYSPYPGFKPFAGAAGEYNGKFMSNQYVLRGSACVTPAGHTRPTYRNFFYPHQSWAFTGLRLAKGLGI